MNVSAMCNRNMLLENTGFHFLAVGKISFLSENYQSVETWATLGLAVEQGDM